MMIPREDRRFVCAGLLIAFVCLLVAGIIGISMQGLTIWDVIR